MEKETKTKQPRAPHFWEAIVSFLGLSFLWVSNCESGVFLIIPSFVTAIRYLSSENSCTGIIAVILSRCIKLRKLTAGVPLAVLVASGTSKALILWAFPG